LCRSWNWKGTVKMGKERFKTMVDSVVQDDKKRKLILIAGIILIGIIFLSGFWNDKKDSQAAQSTAQGITEEEYVQQLEKKVKELLRGIDGVGNPDVMLTLESGSEYVYQSETKRSTDRTDTSGETTQERLDDEHTIVMVEGDNGKKQALIRTELTPKIQGIVVVCDGADQVSVQTQIIDVLTTAFGISSARVSVAKAASSGG
jgi:stage III sporulation protein AG